MHRDARTFLWNWSGADCEDFTQIGTSKDPSFVDLTPATPAIYRYRVRALDAAANVSKYSNPISIEFSARTTAGAR